MTATDCLHPFGALRIDAGRTGQRGQASVMALICDACSTRFMGPLGVARLIESGVEDSDALWRAVISLGGKRGEAPRPRVAGRPAEKPACAHYLAWIKTEVSPATRGYAGVIWITCRGCKVKWTEPVGLAIFLERMVADRRAIEAAIRGLGGKL